MKSLALFLLLAITSTASAQTSSGGPIDCGNGDVFYYTVSYVDSAGVFTLTLTYYGPDFPVPIVVIIDETGKFVMFPLYRDVFPPEFGPSQPNGP